jgi:hypothetical protein
LILSGLDPIDLTTVRICETSARRRHAGRSARRPFRAARPARRQFVTSERRDYGCHRSSRISNRQGAIDLGTSAAVKRRDLRADAQIGL